VCSLGFCTVMDFMAANLLSEWVIDIGLSLLWIDSTYFVAFPAAMYTGDASSVTWEEPVFFCIGHLGRKWDDSNSLRHNGRAFFGVNENSNSKYALTISIFHFSCILPGTTNIRHIPQFLLLIQYFLPYPFLAVQYSSVCLPVCLPACLPP